MTLFSLISLPIKVLLRVSLLFFVVLSNLSYANDSGEVLYQQCIACHGAKGEGVDALKAPAIAGQDINYLTRQLEHFKNGTRGKAEQAIPMAAVAKILTKMDIEALATYIQAMAIVENANQSLIEGSLKNGSRYYQAKCGACHGGQAQGNKTFNAPRLSNQSSQYLLQQMQDFVAGKRGYEQNDKLGRQMAMMANTTKGQELIDILFYISQQSIK
ncbi:MAG: cytochrome c [Colwellia sp.]|nr:cytochrome c [Colwellia sp.]MCW9083104.1 cytochrome c [Colwellia sp.]